MIISGKEISKKIKEQLKVEVEEIKNKYNRLPKLAAILVGENQASFGNLLYLFFISSTSKNVSTKWQ